MINRSWNNLIRYARDIEKNFRILSYNILSDSALFNNISLYQNCNASHLLWNNRLTLIINEIFLHNPDIVCLQEVTRCHFYQSLKPIFTKMNFDGVYKQKNDPKADGCAIFYNNNTFELIGSYGIDIVPILPVNWRTQTAICVVLSSRYVPLHDKHSYYSTKKTSFFKLAIVATHLKFSPKNDFFRSIQAECLLGEIKRLKENGCIGEIPIILCGDFNSKTDSLPIKLILNQVSPQCFAESDVHSDYKTITSTITATTSTITKLNPHLNTSYSSVSNSLVTTPNSSFQMFDFNFKSVFPLNKYATFDKNKPNNLHKMFTTCVNKKHANVVDYIFYHNPPHINIFNNDDNVSSSNNDRTIVNCIEPCGFLKIPSSPEPITITLPNEQHGSDHVPLVADFCYVPFICKTSSNFNI